jgi:hypothetical protein
MTTQSPKPDSFAVMLPCSAETFGDFVSGLLGKPQTIQRTFVGSFDVRRVEIENTFHLVDQRVRQQNKASLIQFTVSVSYDDGSSVLVGSLSDFSHYVEVRPLVSVAAHLTWIYLIQFQDKNVPEKQRIEFWFHTAPTRSDMLDVPSAVLPSTYPWSGDLGFRIEHTARTWGVDLESLLSNHAGGLLKEEHPVARLVYRNSGKIGVGVAALFLLTVFIGAYLSTRHFADQQIATAQAVLREPVIVHKIDFVIERFASGVWTQFNFALTVFLLVALVGAVFLGVWSGTVAENRPPSFVLLTKRAEERRERLMNKRKRQWWWFGASVFVSVVTGVIANILFDYFFTLRH